MAPRTVAGKGAPVTIKEKLNSILSRWKSNYHIAKIKLAIRDQDVDEAANVLAHYHAFHTQDKVTRFRCRSQGPEHPTVDIYIATDAEWRKKLDAVTAEAFEFLPVPFPPPRPPEEE